MRVLTADRTLKVSTARLNKLHAAFDALDIEYGSYVVSFKLGVRIIAVSPPCPQFVEKAVAKIQHAFQIGTVPLHAD